MESSQFLQSQSTSIAWSLPCNNALPTHGLEAFEGDTYLQLQPSRSMPRAAQGCISSGRKDGVVLGASDQAERHFDYRVAYLRLRFDFQYPAALGRLIELGSI
jgi:hypothetical protein